MMKILVIEDDKLVRDSLSLLLESVGYSVIGGATFREGIKNLQGVPVAGLITDAVSLLNNWDVRFGKMRLSDFPNFPIIALEGTMSCSQKKFSPLPPGLRPIYTLQKPFTVDEFLPIIKRVLPLHGHTTFLLF